MSEIMTTVFKQSTNPAAIFKMIDTDNSGGIDMAEMKTKLDEWGLDAACAEKICKALDTNGDGVVDEDEFKAGFETFKATLTAEGEGGGGSGAEEIEFADLKAKIDTAQAAGKCVLICDPSGQAGSFLQYQGAVVDCKGLFVLDKMHGKKTPEEIVEACCQQIVGAMSGGTWSIMELGKSAPQFGEFPDFPLAEIMEPNFGKRENLGEMAIIPEGEKTAGIYVPKGDWADKGHGMIFNTQFGAEDYEEFLSVSGSPSVRMMAGVHG
jgi:hypothetical protein